MVYGLIGAGPVNEYLAKKLPRLTEELGPVAATSHRLASRIVNTLRAGRALRDLSGMQDTFLILICAPNGNLSVLRPVLERSRLHWSGRSVVLCDCDAFSHDLQSIRDRGASVASLELIPGLPGRFVIEGDGPATKAARSLVHQLRGSAIEIEPQNYPYYRAALTFSGSLLTPVLEGCMMSIRQAGIHRSARAQILEALVLQTLRDYLYSGRRSWDGVVAKSAEERMKQESGALQKRNPEIADLYCANAEAAVRLLARPKKIRKPRDSAGTA